MALDIITLVKELSVNFTKILDSAVLGSYNQLNWGGNGTGDRWAKGKFNYTSIYGTEKKKPKTYSENDDDSIPEDILKEFLKDYKGQRGNKIIGIYIHSLRENKVTRTIRQSIQKEIVKNACVSCGSKSDIICDHKNDLYNDPRVLDTKTQRMNDFQALCNPCNLKKRQVSKDERKDKKLHSAKNMPQYAAFNIPFPWENKQFDDKDIDMKKDTYWYDPIEFNKKIYNRIRLLQEIKSRVKIILTTR